MYIILIILKMNHLYIINKIMYLPEVLNGGSGNGKITEEIVVESFILFVLEASLRLSILKVCHHLRNEYFLFLIM